MNFDEQLRRTFDTLTERLREEISRESGGAADELAASAQTDRKTAVAKAVAETRDAAEHEASVRREEAEREASARREEAERQASARLADAVSAAEQRAREKAEREAAARLSHAVTAAEKRAREAAEHNTCESIDAAVASARADLKAADLATSERLVDAVRAIDRARSLSEILDTLASSAGREASRVAVLLVRGEELHGWRFLGFGPAFQAAGQIKVSLQDGGLVAEAVRTGTAVSAGVPLKANATGVDTLGRTAAPSFAQLPAGREVLAVPIPLGGQIVSVLYADQGPTDDQSRTSAITWPGTLEVMARHCARCLEALTAFTTARALTERPGVAPAAPSDRPGSGEPHIAGRTGDDTENGGESARRYARLLVSEIKLYHEAAVVTGQRERDLATRLGAEIARARVLYEQRVAPHLRQGADYFHAELVRTLANGDASLLGV